MSRKPFRYLLVLASVIGLIAAGCGGDDDDSSGATAAAAPTTAASTAAPETTAASTTAVETTVAPEPAVAGDVVVFAAASLTDAFTEIGETFSAANPDASATFNFAASSELVTQINEGAPADVYASADQNNMTKLTDAGNAAGEPEVFATNVLEIIVQPGNPMGIATVADLAEPDLIVVTCAPEVPIGAYSAEVFENAGVTVTPDSYEENVRAVVNKVTLGEADAGVVYATDVTAAGDAAEGVAIPPDLNVVAEYPIAVTAAAPNPDAATAFMAFVLGEEGQAILASYGFLAP